MRRISDSAIAVAILTSVGTGNQEAYQLLQNANGICYGLAYLVMFAIPLVARGEKPGWPLRAAAASGFGMTLLYVILSLFPIIDVPNPLAFMLKTGGVVVGLNVAGALIFRRGDLRRRRALQAEWRE